MPPAAVVGVAVGDVRSVGVGVRVGVEVGSHSACADTQSVVPGHRYLLLGQVFIVGVLVGVEVAPHSSWNSTQRPS